MADQFYQFINANASNTKVVEQYIYQYAQQMDLYEVFYAGLQQKKFSEDAIFIALVYLKNRLRMYNLPQEKVQAFLQLVCELMQTRNILQLKMLQQLLDTSLRNIRRYSQEELFIQLTNNFENNTFCLDAQIYLVHSFSKCFNNVVQKNEPIYEKMILFVCDKLSTENVHQQITLLNTLENIFQPICPSVIYHKYLQEIIVQLSQACINENPLRVYIIQIFMRIMQSLQKMSNTSQQLQTQYAIDQEKDIFLAKQILEIAINGLNDKFDENFFICAIDIIFLGLITPSIKKQLYDQEMQQNICQSIVNTITLLIQNQLFQYEVVPEAIQLQETEIQPLLSGIWMINTEMDSKDADCMKKAFRLMSQILWSIHSQTDGYIQSQFSDVIQLIVDITSLICTQSNYSTIISKFIKLYINSSLLTQLITIIPQSDKQQHVPLQLQLLNVVLQLLDQSSKVSPCVMWHLYQVLNKIIRLNTIQLQSYVIEVVPKFIMQMNTSRTQTELFELNELCITMLGIYLQAIYSQEIITDKQKAQIQDAIEGFVKNMISLNPLFSLYSNLMATLNQAMSLIKQINDNYFNQLFVGLFDNLSIEQFNFQQLVDMLYLCTECLDEENQISQQMFDKIVYVCWFIINSISGGSSQMSYNQLQQSLIRVDDTINKLFSNSYISQLQYNQQLFEIYQRVINISKIYSDQIVENAQNILLNIPDYCKIMEHLEVYNYIYTEYVSIVEANKLQNNKHANLQLIFMIALSFLENQDFTQQIYQDISVIFGQRFDIEKTLIEIPIIVGGLLMHLFNQFIYNQIIIHDLVQSNDLQTICKSLIDFVGLVYSINQYDGDFLKILRQRANKSYEIFIQIAQQHAIYNEIYQKLKVLIDIIEQIIAFKRFNISNSEEHLTETAKILQQYGLIQFKYTHILCANQYNNFDGIEKPNFLSVRQ